MSQLFWLNDEQWSKIEPLLPHYGSPPRVDDRRILSGIIHVLRCGCRWRDCPSDYGPYTTVYNRFNRWSRKGIWQKIYAPRSPETSVPPGSCSPTARTSRRTARRPAPKKGGAMSGDWSLPRRSND